MCFLAGGNARTDVGLQTNASRAPRGSAQARGEVQARDGGPQEPARQGVRGAPADVLAGARSSPGEARAGAREEVQAEPGRREETAQRHHRAAGGREESLRDGTEKVVQG